LRSKRLFEKYAAAPPGLFKQLLKMMKSAKPSEKGFALFVV